uniref:terminase n=1 Tax=Clostridium sp. NkU-1 TaxID=1095009 RepID=UPI0006D06AD4
MSDERLLLSEKYKAFLKCDAPVEFLEGTTAAGKTTVGLFKFMLKVAESPKKLHIIAAKDTGTAEKNIINKDLGIIDDFGVLAEYNGNGTKDDKIPHILFHTSGGDKIIYVMGYGDKKKWQKALGGQYGCLYIDEINTADIEFVRESAMRCDYLMGTLNPDDPNLPIYKEYINCSRPLTDWKYETPKEILEELRGEPKPGWVHWFFSFTHNLGLSKEKLENIIRNTPKGTKIWKNKIEGLRGKATGLIFSNFDRKKHVVSKDHAKQFIRNQNDRHQTEWFVHFSAGLDTSYSQKSPDTISMSFIGITNRGNCYVLDEKVYNNADLGVPLAPTDTVRNFIDFLDRNRTDWGFARDTFIDSADQATITEFLKHKRLYGCIYNFNDAWKKEQIIDRITNQLNWFADAGAKPCFYIVDTCANYIRELEVYSWLEGKDNTPEDKNDHMVNSVQYAWLPYEIKIGTRRRSS